MKKIMIALIGCMILSACSEDILNLKNPAQYDEVTYFKTQKECQEVVAACYSVLTMRPFYGRDWYFMMDLLTGQSTKTSNLEVDLVKFEEFTYQPEHQYIDWAWLGFYRLGMRSLVAIEKLTAWETKSEAEKAYKDVMLGEAYFFYGWAYYFLSELWGDVPFHESWESIKAEPAKARTPYAEVQQKVEEAFTTALSKLPESWDDKNLGRVTKDAARAMLGKVYLTKGDNDKAIQQLESVKASAFHPNYHKLFVRGNHTSPEIIMQVLHKFWGWGDGNAYYMFGGKEDWGNKATNCGRHMEYAWNDWNNVTVSNGAAAKFKYMLNGAEYIDPRNKDIMYGDGVMGSDRWFGFHYTKDNAPSADKIGQLVEYFDDDGKLIDNGTKFPYKPYDGTTLTGYKWKKGCLYEDFEHVDIGDGDYSSILIRVSDVKLLLAEAYIGKANYAKAKDLINEVRTRDAVKAVAYTDLNSSNAFEILKRERYIELFGENHYWMDLLRWDRLGKVDMMKELPSAASAKHKKWPIPTQEKDTNPKMVVTDAWN